MLFSPNQTILFIIFKTLFFTYSVSSTIILPNSSLHPSNPNQTWTSQSNSFVLHFIPIKSTPFFSFCMTYYSSVPVWCPVEKTDINSSLDFYPDGNLRLVNGSGEVVWESNTAHLGVSHAIVNNTGELVLMNASSGSIWRSFDHMTDTLVPTQEFSARNALASGYYSFKVDNNGTMKLMWNNSVNYWSFGLNSSTGGNLNDPRLSLETSGVIALNDDSLSKSLILAYSSDFGEGDDFRYLKLDSDGNLRVYSIAKDSNDPVVRWTAVGDQCQVFGYCGNMGICTYDMTNHPICSCPSKNFDLVDPDDPRRGCKTRLDLRNCIGNHTMLKIDHTLFLTYPPETSTDVYTLGAYACEYNCLYGLSCVASSVLAHDSGQCYMKTRSFVSGHRSATIPGTSFVKVCSPVEPNPPPPVEDSSSGEGSRVNRWMVVAIAIMGASLIVVGGLLWWLRYRNSNPRFDGVSGQYTLLDYVSGAPMQFSYKDLDAATRGFRERLGEGGFGVVYKGMLNKETVVAVKKLRGIQQGEKQFRMEVATISSTHHLNLVRLIGFCSEGRHRLLVYEFMKNGSLDLFLFKEEDEHRIKPLTWEQRFNVVLGTARGITYLHQECRDCILHCDIKPENILLDENREAKVSDFGLAKLISLKDHKYQTLTSVRGTRGYLAPEWLSNSPITSKSDVFSFGMVLLEVVSGRRNYEVSLGTNGMKFSCWAYEEFEKGNLGNLVDKKLGEVYDFEQVMRVMKVVFWCIQEKPSNRPNMGKVVQMLEGVAAVEKPPPPLEMSVVGLEVDMFCTSTTTTPLESPSSSLMRGGAAFNEDGV